MPNFSNWNEEGSEVIRPNLAQRRELSVVLARAISTRISPPPSNPDELPQGMTTLGAPARCNLCWSDSTYAVVAWNDAYHNTVNACMRHALGNSHLDALTCRDCHRVFRDGADSQPRWARDGRIRGTDGSIVLCRPCQAEYTACSECSTRFHFGTQTQCCTVRPRCEMCNIPETDDAPHTANVEVGSRYDYTGTETLRYVCARCEAENLTTCVDCARLMRRRETYEIAGGDSYVCTGCLHGYRATTYQWQMCGRHSIAYREGMEELTCCNPYSHIHSYSYKPAPIMMGDGPMYYGAEIEVCTQDMDSAAEVAGRGFKRHVYLKEDGSIRHGFEMVTHPMSYGYWMSEFPWATLTELRNAGAYAHSSCGIHVHASRAGFGGAAHEHRWLAFFDRNQAQIEKIARRSGSSYARFGTLTPRDKKAIATRKGDHGRYQRYSAVNVNNAHTYEVRIFATSVDEGTIQAAIGFVAATVEYTRHLRSRDVMKSGGMTWTDFRAFVESHPEYAPLLSEMNRVNA